MDKLLCASLKVSAKVFCALSFTDYVFSREIIQMTITEKILSDILIVNLK